MRRALPLLLLLSLSLSADRPFPAEREHRLQAERRPSEWGWLQRTYPHFQADPTAYREALTAAKHLRASGKQARLGLWQPVGPTNVGGRIVDVDFDPRNPDILYAAAATGGLFKSSDAGASWLPLFDQQAVLNIGDFALDPQNPDILYVGTGEANGGHNNFAGAGLFKSTNGGHDWISLGLEATAAIGRVLVHPTNAQRVYAAAVGSYFAPNPERGLYRSDNGGATWDQVLFVNDSTGVIDVVMRPDNPEVLVAATWQRVRRPEGAQLYGEHSGLWRSFDGGDTWHKLGPDNGLPFPQDYEDAPGRVRFGRIGLAICETQPDTMYALYTDGQDYLGLFRTDDGGDTWRRLDPFNLISRGTAGFSWYFGQVRVHPEDPDIVYVLDVSFMRSFDGGINGSLNSGTHVDHHALAFHPDNPDILLNGNDGGLARSFDAGRTWASLGALPITQFYEVNIDPLNPERLYGGTQDNGTIRTPTGGLDEWEALFGGDGFYVNIDPVDPDILYVEYQNGMLFKSIDGGLRFTAARSGIDENEKRNWSTPVVMDPNNSSVLYYGTTRLYRTEDGAESWAPVSPHLPGEASPALLGTITTIAVAPANSNVVYAATDDGRVWMTGDFGDTWDDITGMLPRRWVTRVVVHPEDENTAYVTLSGLKWKEPQPHIFRTTDRGRTWLDVSANLPDAPVNALAIDPLNPQVLYLGSDVGAFVSLDEGLTWQGLGEGLPSVSVYDLKVHAAEHFLVAGTHGRSMYRLDLSEIQAYVAGDDLDPTLITLEPGFPNPFAQTTTLRMRLGAAGDLDLRIYDTLGRLVRLLYAGPADRGLRTVFWDGTDHTGTPVAAGTYFAHMQLSHAAGTSEQSVSLTRVR